jgi:hypoxanthine phosphoribosyltransferase
MNDKILITNKQIIKSISKVGKQITTDFLEKHSYDNEYEPPVFICVLNGAFLFFSTLIQNVPLTMTIDFIRVKSYTGKEHITTPILIKDIEENIKNKEVYICEDLIDSGNTMNFILEHLQKFEPKSIKIVTLLQRTTKFNKIPSDYNCLQIQDEWIYGFGLDDNLLKRNLLNIYTK